MGSRSCTRTRAWQRVGMMIAGVMLGLGIAEIACRVLMDRDRYRPDMLFGTVLVPRDLDRLRRSAERQARAEQSYLEWHPLLGWCIRPHATDRRLPYRSNGDGLRSSREYRRSPPDGVIRVAAFGDSFTHCDEVAEEDSWESILEQSLGGGVEVLNFGVSAYGTDQAFLRYREQGQPFHPHVVVLGLAITDMKRNVNVFPWLRSQRTSWSKPRFVLAGDDLELVNHPVLPPGEVANVIEHGHPLLWRDYCYDPLEWQRSWLSFSDMHRFLRGRLCERRERDQLFDPAGEPMRVTARIVRRFREEVEAAGSTFVCLVIPDGSRFKRARNQPWQPLLDDLASHGIDLIDPSPRLFRLAKRGELFAPGGHFLRAGNLVIASRMAAALRDRFPKLKP